MLRWFLWLCLFVWCVPSISCADFTVDDIVKGLQRRESAVQALSVKAEYQIRHRFLVEPPNSEVALHGTHEVTVDAQDRCRVQSVFDSWHVENQQIVIDRDRSTLGVFDGKVAWILKGSGQHAVGTISENRSELSLHLDPRNVSTHYFNQAVSTRLLKRGASIVGKSTWDGRSVLVVETKPVEDKDQRKTSYYIDPGRNFAVVRRAISVRYPPHERWMEYTRIESYGMREVHAGVWLPDRVVHESFDPTAEHAAQGTDPPLSWRWDVKFSDWKVNPELDDEMFEIQFPLGIFVNNRITGTSYREGQEPAE